MKRYVKIMVVMFLISILLTGCGTKKLKGVYIDNYGISSYEFVGNNVYSTSLLTGKTNTGTYTIHDNVVHIEYEDGGYDEWNYDSDTDRLFIGDGDVIYFTKQK